MKKFLKNKRGDEYIEALRTYPITLFFVFLLAFAIINYITSNQMKQIAKVYFSDAIASTQYSDAEDYISQFKKDYPNYLVKGVYIDYYNSNGELESENVTNSTSDSRYWVIGNKLRVEIEIQNENTASILSDIKDNLFTVRMFGMEVNLLESSTNFSISYTIENDECIDEAMKDQLYGCP